MARSDGVGTDGSEREDSFLDWNGRATLFDDEESEDEPFEQPEDGGVEEEREEEL
jgi:hypothetical protein